MPHLSVSTVVPTYNRARLLERALRSALAECRPGDEIIVVDDGSSDDTEAVVRDLGPALRYLRTPHLGAGAARNAGVEAATGDLVAFLDSDDEWAPGKLAWQRAVMEQFPDVLYLFSDFGGVDWTGERQHERISSWRGDQRPWTEVLGPAVSSTTIAGLPPGAPQFDLHVGDFYDAYLRDWCVYTCTVVVRREQAAAALRFAEDLPTYEDVECFARLARHGLAGYMTCETAWQHGHTGTRLTDADPATRADAAVTIVRRVWGADPRVSRPCGQAARARGGHRRAPRPQGARPPRGRPGRAGSPRARSLLWLSLVAVPPHPSARQRDAPRRDGCAPGASVASSRRAGFSAGRLEHRRAPWQRGVREAAGRLGPSLRRHAATHRLSGSRSAACLCRTAHGCARPLALPRAARRRHRAGHLSARGTDRRRPGAQARRLGRALAPSPAGVRRGLPRRRRSRGADPRARRVPATRTARRALRGPRSIAGCVGAVGRAARARPPRLLPAERRALRHLRLRTTVRRAHGAALQALPPQPARPPQEARVVCRRALRDRHGRRPGRGVRDLRRRRGLGLEGRVGRGQRDRAAPGPARVLSSPRREHP